MKVCVTGGTGFVGSHAVAALIEHGHEVRLFVRSPHKIDAALGPHGLSADDIEAVQGDLTDHDSIGAALEGCDAVLHAASVFSLDPKDAEEMGRVNLAGQRAVIDKAIALGMDPIVHVSSVVGLLHDGVVTELGPDVPVGTSPHPYSGSKAQQEALAREYQADGHPVVIVHPGGVYGPDDPYDGESVQMFHNILKGKLTFCPTGELAITDVRDLAQVFAKVMEPGKGPRSYMAGGHAIPMKDLVKTVGALAGKRLPTVPISAGVAQAFGNLGQKVIERTGWNLPVTAEGAYLGSKVMRPDNSRAEKELGVTFRPTSETLADQFAWQQAAGRL